jgi:4'-phosphopantetheinyl transferase EntD
MAFSLEESAFEASFQTVQRLSVFCGKEADERQIKNNISDSVLIAEPFIKLFVIVMG